MSKDKDKNKQQAIEKAYQEALIAIEDIRKKTQENVSVREKNKNQEKIDAILDKIKKDL